MCKGKMTALRHCARCAGTAPPLSYTFAVEPCAPIKAGMLSCADSLVGAVGGVKVEDVYLYGGLYGAHDHGHGYGHGGYGYGHGHGHGQGHWGHGSAYGTRAGCDRCAGHGHGHSGGWWDKSWQSCLYEDEDEEEEEEVSDETRMRWLNLGDSGGDDDLVLYSAQYWDQW